MPWNETDREKYAVIRKRYASDLSDEEFALVRPLLPVRKSCELQLRQNQRFRVPCFSTSHSPAPHSFNPVLSTIKWKLAVSIMVNATAAPGSWHFQRLGSPAERGEGRHRQTGPSSSMIEPIRPSVWRRASRNTAFSVSAVKIANAEYKAWPPRVVCGAARQPAMAPSLNHSVRLPRWRRLALQSAQLITLRVCLGMW